MHFGDVFTIEEPKSAQVIISHHPCYLFRIANVTLRDVVGWS